MLLNVAGNMDLRRALPSVGANTVCSSLQEAQTSLDPFHIIVSAFNIGAKVMLCFVLLLVFEMKLVFENLNLENLSSEFWTTCWVMKWPDVSMTQSCKKGACYNKEETDSFYNVLGCLLESHIFTQLGIQNHVNFILSFCKERAEFNCSSLKINIVFNFHTLKELCNWLFCFLFISIL